MAIIAIILAFLALAFAITAFIELRSALGSTHTKAYLPSEMLQQMKKTFVPGAKPQTPNPAREPEAPGFQEKLSETNDKLRGETDFDKLF